MTRRARQRKYQELSTHLWRSRGRGVDVLTARSTTYGSDIASGRTLRGKRSQSGGTHPDVAKGGGDVQPHWKPERGHQEAGGPSAPAKPRDEARTD